MASVTIRREVHRSPSRRLRVTRNAATAAPFTSTKQVTESQRSFEPSESRKPAMEASKSGLPVGGDANGGGGPGRATSTPPQLLDANGGSRTRTQPISTST